MESLCSIKSAYEDFEVEIDILPAVDINKPLDARQKEIYEEMNVFFHHPTLIGLILCIIVQFTKGTIYSNKDGKLIVLAVAEMFI